MTDKIQKPNNLSIETLTNEMRGTELGEEEKLWKEVERKQLPPVCYLLGQRSLLCSVQ